MLGQYWTTKPHQRDTDQSARGGAAATSATGTEGANVGPTFAITINLGGDIELPDRADAVTGAAASEGRKR